LTGQTATLPRGRIIGVGGDLPKGKPYSNSVVFPDRDIKTSLRLTLDQGFSEGPLSSPSPPTGEEIDTGPRGTEASNWCGLHITFIRMGRQVLVPKGVLLAAYEHKSPRVDRDGR